MAKRRPRAPVLLNAELNLYEYRPPHRPRTIGIIQALKAKRHYDILRDEHSRDSIEPWTAKRCLEVVAAENEIKVDALRVWLKLAKEYKPGTARRRGLLKPKEKARKK